ARRAGARAGGIGPGRRIAGVGGSPSVGQPAQSAGGGALEQAPFVADVAQPETEREDRARRGLEAQVTEVRAETVLGGADLVEHREHRKPAEERKGFGVPDLARK